MKIRKHHRIFEDFIYLGNRIKEMGKILENDSDIPKEMYQAWMIQAKEIQQHYVKLIVRTSNHIKASNK